jgi:hypothetical protein
MYHCKDSTSNQEHIRQNIEYSIAHAGITSASQLIPITTDMDHFPYNRFYRGIKDCDRPRVFDREAGHRLWRNQDYYPSASTLIPSPQLFEGCFQIPCSTILPCSKDVYKTNIPFCVFTSP